MPVGPSLRQLHAHRAIHEGGLAGAASKTADVIGALQAGDLESANAAADDLLDYWETRIIAHADSEEDGFYQEVAERDPSKQHAVIQLIRDHDLMRVIAADIRELRKTEGLSRDVMMKLHALMIVNEIHSRDEERLLLD